MSGFDVTSGGEKGLVFLPVRGYNNSVTFEIYSNHVIFRLILFNFFSVKGVPNE